MFLHGWSLGKEAFGKQCSDLSDRFRVVIPDMRGHGNSEKFLPGDGIDTLACDLERLLVALDLEEVILVGWSMGALVAWQTATGPQCGRIRGIVTIDMVPRVLNGEGWHHGLRAGAHLYDVDIDLTKMRDDWRVFTRAYMPMVFASGKAIERRELIEQMLDLVADNDLESMTNLWHALVHADFVETVQQQHGNGHLRGAPRRPTDGIEHAGAERQPAQGHDIQRKPENLHDDKRHQDADRDSGTDDERA